MEENKKTESMEIIDKLGEEESSFDLRKLFTMIVLNWQWFLLSMFIFICGAMIYLRYTTPVYRMSAKMLIKDDNSRRRSSAQMLSNMQDLGFISNSTGIENEVEILQSKILACDAVKDLKLYTDYRTTGRIKETILYKNQPLNVDLDPVHLTQMDKDLMKCLRIINMSITKSGSTYQLAGKFTENGEVTSNFQTSFSSLPATPRVASSASRKTPDRSSLRALSCSSPSGRL